jgi:hypothetical protein
MALATSAFWLLVFFPAVMPYDALGIWGDALQGRYDAWHPPALAMLLHATQQVTDQPGLFSFVQGAFFWSALLFLIKQVSSSNRWFVATSASMALLPSLWLYSNAVTSNGWMASFALLSVACAIRAVEQRASRFFWLAVIFFSGAVIFRREALILLPLYLVLYHRFIRVPGEPARAAAYTMLVIVLCIGPVRAIDLAPNVKRSTRSPAGHGLLNQYVGMLVRVRGELDEPQLEAERSDIDHAFGAGTFEQLLKRYNCRLANYISLGFVPVIPEGIHRDDMPYIAGKVASTALRHPMAFVAHNACYYGHLLQARGVSYEHWGVLARDPWISALREKHGVPFDSKLPTLRDRYAGIVNASLSMPLSSMLYSHYLLLIAALVVGSWGARTQRPVLWVPALFALVYPLGYFVFGPASDWRYLLFSYVCGWVCVIAALQHISWARSSRS